MSGHFDTEAGAVPVLPWALLRKPFRPVELLERVREVLDRVA